MDINEIIEESSAENGRSGMIKFNTEIINRVLAETTNLVQMNIKEAERGNLSSLELLTDVEIEMDETKSEEGIVYYVPLGQATNNALLGNLGPQIPVRFNAIGDIRSDVKTKVTEYGINNAYVEVFIHLEVNVQIIIPFATKITTVKQDIPVAMGLVPGEVPQFYGPGEGSTPSLELPVN